MCQLNPLLICFWLLDNKSEKLCAEWHWQMVIVWYGERTHISLPTNFWHQTMWFLIEFVFIYVWNCRKRSLPLVRECLAKVRHFSHLIVLHNALCPLCVLMCSRYWLKMDVIWSLSVLSCYREAVVARLHGYKWWEDPAFAIVRTQRICDGGSANISIISPIWGHIITN